MGLSSRDEVSQLLQQYFEPLCRQNSENWKCKRFIYAQLGAAQGKPGLQRPKCMKCAEFEVCFSPSTKNV